MRELLGGKKISFARSNAGGWPGPYSDLRSPHCIRHRLFAALLPAWRVAPIFDNFLTAYPSHKGAEQPVPPSEGERMLTVSLRWTSHLHKEPGSRPTRTCILISWRATRLTATRYRSLRRNSICPDYLYWQIDELERIVGMWR